MTNVNGRFQFVDLTPGIWTTRILLDPLLEPIGGWSNPTGWYVQAGLLLELPFPVATKRTPTPTVTPGPSPTPTFTPTHTPTVTRTPTVTPTRVPGVRTVSGTVFLDLDADAIPDSGEPRLSGNVVTARKDTLTLQAFTDGNGRFTFPDLDPGTWAIGVQVPSGMRVFYPTVNPIPVAIQANTQLDLSFALVALPTATPTSTPGEYRDYLPLLLSEGES